MTTIREYFYTVHCWPNLEYRETVHHNSLAEAKAVASRASLYSECLVEVRSSVENECIEAWAHGSRFTSAYRALEHAQSKLVSMVCARKELV